MKSFYAIAAIGILTLPALPAGAELADGIKAIVHDSIITYQQVEDYAAPVVDQLRQFRNQQEVFQKKLAETLDESLDVLLENQLILHDFDSAGIYKFPEGLVDEQVEAYIRSAYGGDRVRFIKGLQAEGKTFEQFRNELRERRIIEYMRYAHGSSEVIVSPHKIEVYYVEHKDQFKVEPEVKLRMIVLTNNPAGDTNETRKLAGEILTKINEGATFAEMASIHSDGAQRSQGGEWGWVEKSVLRKELADVAFTLKPGEKSGVIETPEACYLMLVEDKRPEHIKPLNEVRDDIEKTLLAQEGNRLQKQWIDRLKKKTFVRYFY
jgi:parvulin-like peptidyl-prolyl isomerase